VIVYCGTSNAGKLREFQLAAADFEIRGVNAPTPEESGLTFEDTARAKALYYGSHAEGWTFADDSGLEVDALDGAPGVYSARFAGPDANDERNNALLIERLRNARDRSARFVCVIALARHGRVEKTFHGTVEGQIIDAPRGSNGFGYDPLFHYEPFGCTFGEATDEQKMQVSHRAQALKAMFDHLRAISR
jgi:XTP/dITP diphosphohydrolase